jgi:hypothetical protein
MVTPKTMKASNELKSNPIISNPYNMLPNS